MITVSLSQSTVDELRSVLSVVAAPPAPVDTAPWPRMLEFAQPFGPNVRVRADAPINWQWRPSLTDIIFGSQPGSYVTEPSNGASIKQPLRSPAGYPLVYAVAGDTVVGTPSVLFDGRSFNSDAEVESYITRSGPVVSQGQPDYTGPIPVASLTLEDKMFLARSAPGLAQRALRGTAAEVHAAINEAGSANAALTASFDVASYSGPLKGL